MSLSIIVVGIICLFIGFLISCLIKTTQVKQKNQELEKEEQKLQLQIKDLEKDYLIKKDKLDQDYKNQQEIYRDELQFQQDKNNQFKLNYTKEESNLKTNLSLLENQIEEKKKSINELDDQAKTAIKLVEEQVIDNMTNTVEQQSKELYSTYEKLESELKIHYTDLADELYDKFQEHDERLNNLILTKENELNELQSKAKAAVEANRRMELEKQQKDFYRLQLSNIDLEEIKHIRSIESYLRKKEPLNKVIWKVYYEKPCTDLIGRVVGQGKKTGIYKITNIDNGMCYIGQAVDIAERWKQHIKRGIGADPPTQNKLYPAMLSIGVENFTFEVIEECAGNLLNDREDYWQEFYQAQEFGYSIK